MPDVNQSQSIGNIKSTGTIKSTQSNKLVTTKSAVSTSAKGKTEATKTTMFTINLKVEQPDIVLVEHMDNIDTRALILNVSKVLYIIYYLSNITEISKSLFM